MDYKIIINKNTYFNYTFRRTNLIKVPVKIQPKSLLVKENHGKYSSRSLQTEHAPP